VCVAAASLAATATIPDTRLGVVAPLLRKAVKALSYCKNAGGLLF
jgi:hypothetical protein